MLCQLLRCHTGTLIKIECPAASTKLVYVYNFYSNIGTTVFFKEIKKIQYYY